MSTGNKSVRQNLSSAEQICYKSQETHPPVLSLGGCGPQGSIFLTAESQGSPEYLSLRIFIKEPLALAMHFFLSSQSAHGPSMKFTHLRSWPHFLG